MLDAHCHLYMLGEAERLEALARAAAAGVSRMLVPSTHGEDAPLAVALAASEAEVSDGSGASPRIVAAVGFHPHEANRFEDADVGRLRAWLGEPGVVAIGEIGLDFHYMHSPRETQIEVLGRQLEIAAELERPVILHNRDSTRDLLDILSRPAFSRVRGLFHSFTGNRDDAEEAVGRGYMLSFSGMITFKNASAIRSAAAWCPLDALLSETDTPFLTPAPHRGKPNEPAYVVEVVRKIAEVKGLPVAGVEAAIARNFERLFGR